GARGATSGSRGTGPWRPPGTPGSPGTGRRRRRTACPGPVRPQAACSPPTGSVWAPGRASSQSDSLSTRCGGQKRRTPTPSPTALRTDERFYSAQGGEGFVELEEPPWRDTGRAEAPDHPDPRCPSPPTSRLRGSFTLVSTGSAKPTIVGRPVWR